MRAAQDVIEYIRYPLETCALRKFTEISSEFEHLKFYICGRAALFGRHALYGPKLKSLL